ncbi:tRNA glutamyl-Q(34) synthetase GluQRS [Oceaniserpentilla sp. 4NH20-0058]|uniref:tRNA glutamyl-Q(34) synthetase GluQRS n=1 Tax=Oceaniserpentilla sp. 4NH20-0058 TaxID=3127660 RepID=UPI00310B18CE
MPMNHTHPYIGRFAPTPTGPLHFGSLVAALASYLDAKSQNGKWLLRIEDLDPPREDPNASTRIPKQLLEHGLQWDGDIQYQSQHSAQYEKALQTLVSSNHTFHCQCSRKQLATNNGLHLGPCLCLTQDNAAIRLQVPDANYAFTDGVYGHIEQNLHHQVGDPILKRKDGLYAYQLAVVVDDYLSCVNHVVRGVDLLDNTPRQLFLMECLGYPAPHYLHIPLITNPQGQKLSKQNQATAIDPSNAKDNLLAALQFLNQPINSAMRDMPITSLLQTASNSWQANLITPSHAGLI